MKELFGNFQGYFRINIPRIKWIVVFGLLFFVLYLILRRKGYVKNYKKPIKTLGLGMLLSMNCSFIFVMTLFGRKVKETREVKVIPFESYNVFITKGSIEILLQIIVNIAMFVTLGFLLPCCFQVFKKYKNIVFAVLVCSASIEANQLIFKLGLFEIDDIIHNVLGSIIGISLYVLYNRVRKVITTKMTQTN